METTQKQKRGMELSRHDRLSIKVYPNTCDIDSNVTMALTGQDSLFEWGKEEEQALRMLKDSITNDDTMVYFDPKTPIVIWTEESLHVGCLPDCSK